MKKNEHNEQLGMSTLGFVFARVAHFRRFTRPEAKHQALYGHFVCSFGLVLGWWGYLGIIQLVKFRVNADTLVILELHVIMGAMLNKAGLNGNVCATCAKKKGKNYSRFFQEYFDSQL